MAGKRWISLRRVRDKRVKRSKSPNVPGKWLKSALYAL